MFIGHDLGTGGDKAVLVAADGTVVAEAFHPYPLVHPRPGWAEQDPDHYWEAVCATTTAVLEASGYDPASVQGIGYAGQMLTQVPVDARGEATRPAISWLDARAGAEAAALTRRMGGATLVRAVVGAVPSGKDVVAKWAWIRRHEPAVWERTAALTDVTGYVVARSTSVIVADHTAGGGTGMINRTRRQWSTPLLALAGMGPPRRRARLPGLRACTDVVGGLTPQAAADLGLRPGTPVVAGMGDVPAAQVGSGAVRPGDAHVCLGTSAWLCLTTTSVADIASAGVYSLPAADLGTYATVAEMETAGECLDWLARVLSPGAEEAGAVAALIDEAAGAPPGCDGLTFAPWLFGERAPVNDTTLRGVMLGLSLDHGRGHMVRAVLEGVAHNLRWVLEEVGRRHEAPTRLRVIGGGVRSELWLQSLADICGVAIDTIDHPQFAGARGAAMLAAVGTGSLGSIAEIADITPVAATYQPDRSHAAVHERSHAAFRSALPAARAHRRALGPPAI